MFFSFFSIRSRWCGDYDKCLRVCFAFMYNNHKKKRFLAWLNTHSRISYHKFTLKIITWEAPQLGAIIGRWSDKWRESRQWSSRSRHIIHNNLTTIETHNTTAFWLRVRVTRVISHRLLSLPALPQWIIHIGIVIHERVRIWPHTFILTLRILPQTKYSPQSANCSFHKKNDALFHHWINFKSRHN